MNYLFTIKLCLSHVCLLKIGFFASFSVCSYQFHNFFLLPMDSGLPCVLLTFLRDVPAEVKYSVTYHYISIAVIGPNINILTLWFKGFHSPLACSSERMHETIILPKLLWQFIKHHSTTGSYRLMINQCKKKKKSVIETLAQTLKINVLQRWT